MLGRKFILLLDQDDRVDLLGWDGIDADFNDDRIRRVKFIQRALRFSRQVILVFFFGFVLSFGLFLRR